jgi:hypothetical protein
MVYRKVPEYWRWVFRPPAMDEMIRFFGVDDPEELVRRYDAALEQLDADPLLSLDYTLFEVSDYELEHFRDDWLGGRYFPGLEREDVARIICEGLAEALLVARDASLPVEVVWVAVAPEGTFRVEHVASDRAVTIVFVTPEPATSETPDTI